METTKTRSRGIVSTVLILTLTRLIVNLTRRFAYPLAPEIARTLGEPLENVQMVISLQSGTGATSPLFSPLAERYGRKRVMMGALGLMALVAFIGALRPVYGIFLLVMVMFGAGKTLFDPAMQAYIGDRVPYNRRGLAIGTTELSWAGSLIIVTPLAAFLITHYGLQGVFLTLAVLFLMAFALIQFTIPADHAAVEVGIKPVSPVEAMRILARHPAALAVVCFMLAVAVSNEIFFINFGVWMESTFSAAPETITLATSVIALAEVSGEFSIIGLSDRFGKKRMALSGAMMAAGIYCLLLTTPSLPVALLLLFVMFFSTEVAIVAGVTIATEVLPEARAVMMSSIAGFSSLGRLLGGVLGGFLYATTGSFLLMGVMAMVIGFGGAFLMRRFVKE